MIGSVYQPQSYARVSNDAEPLADTDDVDLIEGPETSSVASQLVFGWLAPIIAIAQNRILTQEDMLRLPPSYDSAVNRKKLHELWGSTDTGKSSSERKGLLRSLFEVFGFEYASLGFFLLCGVSLSLCSPLLLHKLIVLAQEPTSTGLEISFFVILLFLVRISAATLNTQYTFRVSCLSVRVGAAIKGNLFHKIMRLSTESKREYTTGALSNLYTTDTERVTEIMVQGHRFWALPLQITVSMVVLFFIVHYAMIFGLCAIIIVMSINRMLSARSKRENDFVQAAKDVRMGDISACFSSSLVIKLNVWESKFQEKIFASRAVELQHIWNCMLYGAINICLLWLAPCLVSTATIASYARMSDVRAAEVFTALSLFKSLQDPFRDLPGIITQYFQMKSSLQRLQKLYFMGEREFETFVRSEMSKMETVKDTSSPPGEVQANVGRVVIDRCSLYWGKTEDSIGAESSAVSAQSKGDQEEGSESGDTDADMDKSSSVLLSHTDALDDKDIDIQQLEEDKDDHSISVFVPNKRRGIENHSSPTAQRHVVPTVSLGQDSLEDVDLEKGSTKQYVDEPAGFQLQLPAFQIQRGDLVVIAGATGSGKSSVISALLGNMYLSEESARTTSHLSSADFNAVLPLRLYGNVAYASQQAWIQNETVLENILMGTPLDEEKLQRVIDACALSQDLTELGCGLTQQIGEKGVGLSGGQKARVALARAFYADADIILLDDVFAALDVAVGRHVFRKGVLELLYGKTIILVTHNKDVLKHDRVNVLCHVHDGCATFTRVSHPDMRSISNAAPSVSPTQMLMTPNKVNLTYIFAHRPWPVAADVAGKPLDLSTWSSVPDAPANIEQNTPNKMNELGFVEDSTQTEGMLAINTIRKLSIESAGSAGSELSDTSGHGTIRPRRNKSFAGRPQKRDVPEHEGVLTPLANAPEVLKSKRSALFRDEERAEGSIGKHVYLSYINAMGGVKMLLFLCCVQITWQSLSISSDLWLSYWTGHSDSWQAEHVYRNILIYGLLSMGSGCIVFIRTTTIATGGYRASKVLFERMTQSLLQAPMSWLDSNPSGRILNRFSHDMSKVDMDLPYAVGGSFAVCFNAAGTLTAVSFITRWLVLIAIPIAFLYGKIMNKYVKASREIQRMQQTSQSPVLSFMSEVSDGTAVINSFTAQQRFLSKNDEKVNLNAQMNFMAAAAQAWFVIRVQALGGCVLLFICMLAFGQLGKSITPSLVGLSLSYGLAISDQLQSVVMLLSWFENSMVCPERVLQYCDVSKEGTEYQKLLFKGLIPTEESGELITEEKWTLQNKKEQSSQSGIELSPMHTGAEIAKSVTIPGQNWVAKGQIEFKNVSFRYQPNSEDVLIGLTCLIKPGEKVGVVGRTGSGKSTLSMCLFRIAELHTGTILIDNYDSSAMPLSDLRSAIEIIPQNPVVLKGSVRLNIDPFSAYSDEQIYATLEKTRLLRTVTKMYEQQQQKEKRLAQRSELDASKMDEKAIAKALVLAKIAGHTDLTKNKNRKLANPAHAVLDAQLDESGGNLSVGEKQLLVMARALLVNARILVMDEATANIDNDTDEHIQRLLEHEFRSSTVLTIAHRLHTIMKCDRIMVMSAGQLAEFDSPQNLLQTPGSIFASFAAEQSKQH